MKPSRIIDTHQHVFWHGRDDRGLIADMDEHGIDCAWLLTWEIAPGEDDVQYHGVLNPVHRRDDGTHRGIPLEDLLRARDAFPGRFVLGYCPHPLARSPEKLLEAAVEMYGIRVCGEWKCRLPFDDPRCLELFRAAGAMNLPVVLHLDVPYLPDAEGKPVYQPNWYGGTVHNLERALQACPETVFMGHAPGFWREISGDADASPDVYPDGPVVPGGRLYRLFEAYPNLRADLSAASALRALARDHRHAIDFLVRFRERLFFGRDYYGGDLNAFLQGLELDRETVACLFHRNAERLFAHP